MYTEGDDLNVHPLSAKPGIVESIMGSAKSRIKFWSGWVRVGWEIKSGSGSLCVTLNLFADPYE